MLICIFPRGCAADPSGDSRSFCATVRLRQALTLHSPPRLGHTIDRSVAWFPTDAPSRAGNRIAWSCEVEVLGKSIAARFWYDGRNVNGAREDAALEAYRYIYDAMQKAQNGSS